MQAFEKTKLATKVRWRGQCVSETENQRVAKTRRKRDRRGEDTERQRDRELRKERYRERLN